MPIEEPEPGAGVVFWTRAVAVGEVSVTITDPERPPSERCWYMVEWYDGDYNGNDWNDRSQEKIVPQNTRTTEDNESNGRKIHYQRE